MRICQGCVQVYVWDPDIDICEIPKDAGKLKELKDPDHRRCEARNHRTVRGGS